MYYKVDIFFRNIHHLSDGRFAAGVWAKWASFNFDKDSEHYISPVDASEIMGWMSGPAIVAEFGPKNSFDNILEVTKLLKIENIAIPYSLLSQPLIEHFNEIIITDKSTNEYHYFKDKIVSNKKAIISPELNMAGAHEILASKVQSILIEGIKEDKPGTADYESLSLFMEHLDK